MNLKKSYIPNIKLISKDSKLFPIKLLDLPDCPEVLFVIGNEKILNDISVSIVGTRKSSKLGNDIAFNLSNQIASNNIVVVSGLANGIDSQAHIGTFDCGKTIAIIACGFNHIFKSKNKDLVDKIISNNGAIISEYFPDTPPQNFTYLRRNRLIATLSEITIVIEAPLHSGSLHTAQTALKYNRSVFSIPWSINISKGEGCNFLIKNGSKLLTNSAQIVEVLSKKNHTTFSSNTLNSQTLSLLNPTSISNIQNKYSNSGNKLEIPSEYIPIYNFIKKNEPVSRFTLDTSPFIENIADLNSKLTLMELQGLIVLNR